MEWIFILPRAPHFGGLWEAAVKAAKHRLVRGAGNANLTHDELNTHIVDVEALRNSRPLAVEGNNPNDGEPLTPGRLLLSQALTMQPREHAQHGKQSVFKAMAAAVGAEAAVLLQLVQGLSAQPPAAITMDNRDQQLSGGSRGADSRRQHTAPEMESRARLPSHRRRRPQGPSGRGANRNRHR